MKLQLAKELAVPVDIVTEALGWLGARGSGKTHGAGKLAEQFAAVGVPFVVLDPVGTWWGLRLAKNGKDQAIKIPVFGGLHADVPLEPTAGALIADLIVDKNLSAVLDVSQFDTDADKARFAAAFAERMFQRKKKDPGTLHLFIEEAQEFVPQNPQPGEQMMLHRFHRYIKLGRNFGLGVSVITQRPQEVAKKALNQCQTIFSFRLTGPQERKAVAEWMNSHDVDLHLLTQLPSLNTGVCFVWSPAFLKVARTFHIDPKETFDASATPKFGQHRAARELAPLELDAVREAMKATIEKAKAEDPKVLQSQLARLKFDLEQAKDLRAKLKPVSENIKRVEVPILKKGEIDYLTVIMNRMDKLAERFEKEAADLHASARYLGGHITEAHKRQAVPPSPPARVPSLSKSHPALVAAIARQVPRQGIVACEVLTGPQARILGALVFLESLGIPQAEKNQVALFVGASPTSSTYANNMGALRSGGLVDYPAGGLVALTEYGRANAPQVDIPQTTGELHALVLSKVTRPQQSILQRLLNVYPEKLLKTELAEDIGASATSSTFANNLGALRTLGLISYPKGGEVRAAGIMFISDREAVAA